MNSNVSEKTEAPTTSSETSSSTAVVFDEEKVLSQLEVSEYSYKNDYFRFHFITIKNNSDFDLEISANVKYYNNENALVGAKSQSQVAFGKGTETVLAFMPDEEYSSTVYELSVSEEEWFECAVTDLTYESVPAQKKEIVSITNNGTQPADFVEVYALFFNGDVLVDHSRGYFTDDDNEIKPGKTITEELDCQEVYDSVKFYITARR